MRSSSQARPSIEQICADVGEALRRLRRDSGPAAVESVGPVLVLQIEWLNQWGQGDLKLSAKDHRFGAKIRADTVLAVSPMN